jgi:hypothetical protein
MPKSEWHYPRREFAEQVYSILVESPSAAATLFGPRRTGKTEFLIEDLAPLAEKRGHRVVYASLWQTPDAPLATLLYAFDAALRGGKLSDRIANIARGLAPKLKLKPPGGGAEIEVDLGALRGKPQDNHLLLLDQYCGKLASARKPTLLLFDEFQELARTKTTGPIIAALRTSLDTRRRELVSVFTGSSQEGLRKVFSAKDAPFFRFATDIELPVLDAAFVDHQLGVFSERAKRKINRAEALKVFRKVGKSPLFFQQWLIAMMAHARLTGEQAIDRVLDDMGRQFAFDQAWEKLAPLQRAVTNLLAQRVDQIYSADSVARLAAMTKGAAPGDAAILAAIRRLSRLGLAEKQDDRWTLTDPLFELWVLAREDRDLVIR